MSEALIWAEKAVLLAGIVSLVFSVSLYGRRSHDWQGVVTMFYKRIPMQINEYKWYRAGIGLVVLAVVLRIVTLTFWP